jgi:hypothetical protein
MRKTIIKKLVRGLIFNWSNPHCSNSYHVDTRKYTYYADVYGLYDDFVYIHLRRKAYDSIVIECVKTIKVKASLFNTKKTFYKIPSHYAERKYEDLTLLFE